MRQRAEALHDAVDTMYEEKVKGRLDAGEMTELMQVSHWVSFWGAHSQAYGLSVPASD